MKLTLFDDYVQRCLAEDDDLNLHVISASATHYDYVHMWMWRPKLLIKSTPVTLQSLLFLLIAATIGHVKIYLW